MAINPMQRKARNSFLLGMFITLLITGAIIGVLAYLLISQQKAEKAEKAEQRSVFVLNSNVTSGQVITVDMLRQETVPMQVAPENAVASYSTFVEYSLVEKSTGKKVGTDQNGLYLDDNGNKVRIAKDENSGNYYKVINNQRALVEFTDEPLIAKTNLSANTVMSLDLLTRGEEALHDDLRVQEFNMLALPVKLDVNEYVDVRITLPSGEDYIVLSKKRVLDVLEDTVWLKVSEEDILRMSNAIVETYVMTGSKLSITKYVEPGLQKASTPTYAVSEAVLTLIQNDPNIRNTAKTELFKQYTDQKLAEQRTKDINGQLEKYAEEAKQNIESRVQEENEARRELREKYLEQLSAAAAMPVTE